MFNEYKLFISCSNSSSPETANSTSITLKRYVIVLFGRNQPVLHPKDKKERSYPADISNVE